MRAIVVPILLSWDIQHILVIGEVLTGLWWENFGRRDHFKYRGVDGRITLKWIIKKYDGIIQTGLICLVAGTNGDFY